MNRVKELLGIDYPIIQGGMAWIADAQLAAAVSNAGGFGVISAGSAPAGYVREQIRLARELTDKPFGVNIMLLNPDTEAIFEVAREERVKAVITGAGNPSKYVKPLKEAGVLVLPVVPSSGLARMMEKLGADAVICEGSEAGGHIGDLTTMVLTPHVRDSVAIPVIAAGGIADGRGIAAVLMLGAEGVQVGTRFLASVECTVHQNYKDRVLKARDTDNAVTGRANGHPCRVLRNDFSRASAELEKGGVAFEEYEEFLSGTLRSAAKDGDVKNGSVMAGQCAAMVNEILPVKDIIENMFTEAKAILQRPYEL